MAILRTMAERLRETNAMLSERAAKNVVEEIEKNLDVERPARRQGRRAQRELGVHHRPRRAHRACWIVVNRPGLVGRRRSTPYPYVFFNLLLAILVALQGPLIVMSQNRQTLKDRATAETDFKVNLKNEVNIETILRELGEFRAEANKRLETLEALGGTTERCPTPIARRSSRRVPGQPAA